MPGSSSRSRTDTAPWDKLTIGGVYILLFVRDQPPQPNNFHWGLYVHTEPKGGYKYHIKGMGRGWIADHGPTNGVFKSFLLVGLFHIATIDIDRRSLGQLDGLMRTYDNQLNTPGITCRVWVLWVLQQLQNNGLLKCNDLQALESEVFNFGNKYAVDAADGKQPRPIKVSKICKGL